MSILSCKKCMKSKLKKAECKECTNFYHSQMIRHCFPSWSIAIPSTFIRNLMLLIHRSPFQVSANLVSRQCKAGLHLKWFRDISKLSPLVPGDKSPAEIKVMAQDYQTVKAEFFQHCLENSIGKWVHIPQGPWTCKY